MVAYSTTAMILAVGTRENAASGRTLLVTIYFVFTLVSVNFASVRGNFSPCFFIHIHLDKLELHNPEELSLAHFLIKKTDYLPALILVLGNC